VISSPLHVQDVPARYSPQMGWEGANVIFDSWVHPLMMGLEEHLIGMFRHDFEFVDGHRSHLGDGAPERSQSGSPSQSAASEPLGAPGAQASAAAMVGGGMGTALAQAQAPVAEADPWSGATTWSQDGEAELAKIPFFVRGKVKRNTETFARERQLAVISAETLYDAKAHFSR
jgi:light-independent protochlorophyllide reductase subunit B